MTDAKKSTTQTALKRGVNRFSDRRIWPQKAHGLWIFAFFSAPCINRADSRILKTLWIVNQLCILAWNPDCAFLAVRTLGLRRNLDHRSFFRMVGMLISSSILFIFSNKAN